MRTIFSVPDISCEHCRQAISGAVAVVCGVTAVDVVLDRKEVLVDGDVDGAAVVAAIEAAGYEVATRV
jgi:copper chaperone